MKRWVIGVLCVAALGNSAWAQAPEPISPLPLQVEQDPKRVALGAKLFADVRLSHGDFFSCASCHPLARGGMNALRRGVGYDGKKRLRNIPTVFNVRFNLYLNWDGAHESLVTHTDAIIQSPALMNTPWPELLDKLKGAPDYPSAFGAAYADGITRTNVIDALVHYERSLITPNARFDRYLRGQKDAISAGEARGYQLFKSYGCITCHQGVNIGGNLVQKFGVFVVPDTLGAPNDPRDPGRFNFTKDERDKEVFRVPSLRNVGVTAPYFHDGRAATLEEAVKLMGMAQLGRTLTPEDIRLIASFLRTLTGEYNGHSLGAPGADTSGPIAKP
jgi:cytochrome c peroxidase